MAGVEAIPRRDRHAVALVLVLVEQLVARLDRAQRVDVDAVVLDHRFAVRLARVVDERGIVAPDRAVDDVVHIDREQEGVVPRHLLVIVPPIGLLVGDDLARVLDDAGAAPDTPQREGTPSLNRRPAKLEVGVVVAGHAQRRTAPAAPARRGSAPAVARPSWITTAAPYPCRTSPGSEMSSNR